MESGNREKKMTRWFPCVGNREYDRVGGKQHDGNRRWKRGHRCRFRKKPDQDELYEIKMRM